jgi:hypothetical protein
MSNSYPWRCGSAAEGVHAGPATPKHTPLAQHTQRSHASSPCRRTHNCSMQQLLPWHPACAIPSQPGLTAQDPPPAPHSCWESPHHLIQLAGTNLEGSKAPVLPIPPNHLPASPLHCSVATHSRQCPCSPGYTCQVHQGSSLPTNTGPSSQPPPAGAAESTPHAASLHAPTLHAFLPACPCLHLYPRGVPKLHPTTPVKRTIPLSLTGSNP